MAAAVLLGDDFDGPDLRRLAKGSKGAGQARRLLALAEICDGGSRSDSARVGGVGLQTIRDWVLRFNAGGPTVGSTVKRNGSSKPDFDVPAKLRQERLDRGSVGEAFARGEVDGHGDLLDVVFADLVEIRSARQPSSDPPVGGR